MVGFKFNVGQVVNLHLSFCETVTAKIIQERAVEVGDKFVGTTKDSDEFGFVPIYSPYYRIEIDGKIHPRLWPEEMIDED